MFPWPQRFLFSARFWVLVRKLSQNGRNFWLPQLPKIVGNTRQNSQTKFKYLIQNCLNILNMMFGGGGSEYFRQMSGAKKQAQIQMKFKLAEIFYTINSFTEGGWELRLPVGNRTRQPNP
jgi:hypothetical protein